MEKLPVVSVVVPVLNRQQTIGRCSESLLRMDYPCFEVIVVDNGSTDKSREIASTFPVRLASEGRKGPYAARNRGVELVQGDLVLFIDSDCIANEDPLRSLVKNVADESVGSGWTIADVRASHFDGAIRRLRWHFGVHASEGVPAMGKEEVSIGGDLCGECLVQKRCSSRSERIRY